MNLLDFYPGLKSAHVGCVYASGMLFAARGVGTLAGARWPAAGLVRRLSYMIDSGLLLFALLLLFVLRWNPLVIPWIATKLSLLVIYIVLGSLALKRARGRGTRAVCFVAALMCFGFIVTVARAHDPLGLLRMLVP